MVEPLSSAKPAGTWPHCQEEAQLVAVRQASEAEAGYLRTQGNLFLSLLLELLLLFVDVNLFPYLLPFEFACVLVLLAWFGVVMFVGWLAWSCSCLRP